jgi:hypothetical protein
MPTLIPHLLYKVRVVGDVSYMSLLSKQSQNLSTFSQYHEQFAHSYKHYTQQNAQNHSIGPILLHRGFGWRRR